MDQWDRQYLGQGLPPPAKNYIKQNSHTQKKPQTLPFWIISSISRELCYKKGKASIKKME